MCRWIAAASLSDGGRRASRASAVRSTAPRDQRASTDRWASGATIRSSSGSTSACTSGSIHHRACARLTSAVCKDPPSRPVQGRYLIITYLATALGYLLAFSPTVGYNLAQVPPQGTAAHGGTHCEPQRLPLA